MPESRSRERLPHQGLSERLVVWRETAAQLDPPKTQWLQHTVHRGGRGDSRGDRYRKQKLQCVR
jgi:hypothetical protein